MPFEIVPEPEPGERAAIAVAVAALAEQPSWTPGAWWRVGLEDALTASDEGPFHGAPPSRP
jgi:hypothetical protein